MSKEFVISESQLNRLCRAIEVWTSESLPEMADEMDLLQARASRMVLGTIHHIKEFDSLIFEIESGRGLRAAQYRLTDIHIRRFKKALRVWMADYRPDACEEFDLIVAKEATEEGGVEGFIRSMHELLDGVRLGGRIITDKRAA